jgi:hypothetical protein
VVIRSPITASRAQRPHVNQLFGVPLKEIVDPIRVLWHPLEMRTRMKRGESSDDGDSFAQLMKRGVAFLFSLHAVLVLGPHDLTAGAIRFVVIWHIFSVTL